jgi:hypothetical protein
MHKTFILVLFILVSLCTVSCEPIGGGVDAWYYIYITGDTGRTVQISYLERKRKKNIPITEDVVLPFFKEVHYCYGSATEVFLEVVSDNDSTTKAVTFDNDFFVLISDGNKCFSVVGNLTGNVVEYGSEDCDTCTTCKDLTSDSILQYFKKSNYPCYLEFSQGDLCKRVRMYDYWRSEFLGFDISYHVIPQITGHPQQK